MNERLAVGGSLATRIEPFMELAAEAAIDGKPALANAAALGAPVVADLYPCELCYLVQHEFAHTAQDILWRRTHLGLTASPDAAARLEAWLSSVEGLQKTV